MRARVRVTGLRCQLAVSQPAGRGSARILSALLKDLADVSPRRDQFEHAAVDLPVAKLLSLVTVVTEVADVEPVAEVVQDHAALAPERANWPGLPDSLDIGDAELPAPMPRCGLESKVLGRRACREQHDVVVGGADPGLERGSSVARH
jgi:hypothetical protein